MSSQVPIKHETSSQPISAQTFHIAGIITVVYGLDEVKKNCKSVSCLWLLHPRLQTKETMAQVANSCISSWNSQLLSGEIGLIAATFDQRNHGSREVDPLANLSWRKGNEKHSIDMFSILHGTAIDTSLLIEHIGSYIFQGSNFPKIDDHIVLGVSLGGHSAWQVLMNEEKISCGVVIIGCPDYMSLMSDRAHRSGRESAGAQFLGSLDFPRSLLRVVQKRDPRGILFGAREVTMNPSEAEQKHLRILLEKKLKNKHILVCSGGDDKLVPYRCSEPFLKFLENASIQWYNDGNLRVQNKIYPGIGHTFSDEMLRDSILFVTDHLNRAAGNISPKV
ncbi:putative alpha beta hydrolase fold-containing protein [Erysiphe neolycopersici]|uniref:Putative alpha beta hydrolase fold-containing protein n=1 Tax=Erysiphe neolycopersici TaxID=212602 RepID=A0A420H6V5_9PEZI|nr:putative alpha beta hydrolase fold-containing protein [Erysiphe neolycopersici]